MLLFATGLLLHSYRYYVAASAIFFLSVVVHPALLLGAALYTIGVFWAYVSAARSNTSILNIEQETRGARILTLTIVVMVVIAIALEGIYVLHHLSTFHQHMLYQIERKAGRDPIRVLLTKRGFFLVIEAVFTFCCRWYLLSKLSGMARLHSRTITGRSLSVGTFRLCNIRARNSLQRI